MIAQVRFLTFADDLPSFTALVLTSNSHLEDLEERFHTRGYCVDVRGPSAEELFEFLRQFHSDPDVIQGVVECACSGNGQGNVRQALYNLDLAMLAAAA
jgi:hypothetical protein